MKVYHGSTVAVRRPSLRNGRKRTDFGKGFYTTTHPEQAEHWAKHVQKRRKTERAVVSVYEIDESVLTNGDMSVREFHGVDRAWLDFVVNNRKSKPELHGFDFVLGPVANDNVYATVNLYEDGVLDAESAINQLKAYKVYNQLSFHTSRAIKMLKFVESYEVPQILNA
jgi:hypothetical protein